MRRLTLILSCTALLATVTAMAQVAARQSLDQVVDAAAGRGFSGVVLAGDLKTVSYERAVGIADRETKVAHRADEVWRWASVTKQVTAALVMQQVDRGKLVLEKPAGTYLQQMKVASGAAVTLRNLLQHTSGLPNPDDAATGAAGVTADATENVPPFYRAKPALNGAQRLAFCLGPRKSPPGQRFEYNNCDYIVLGAILEKVTGKKFAALVQAEINGKLGTSLSEAKGAASDHAAVRGYMEKGAIEPAINLAAFDASGAISGTPRDLLAFDRALLTHRLVSEASTKVLWAGDPKLGYAALGAWSFPASLKHCAQEVALVERRGDIGGVQVRNIMAPALGRVLIVFTNSAAVEFGEIWQGSGFSYDLLDAAFCSAH